MPATVDSSPSSAKGINCSKAQRLPLALHDVLYREKELLSQCKQLVVMSALGTEDADTMLILYNDRRSC
jgi:hypothetical protein